MKPQLNDYLIFSTVAETGSASKAAAALQISQPTVTRSLQDLETRLCRKLFTRVSTGMVLTPEGIRLAEMVRPLIREYTLLETGLQHFSDPRISLQAAVDHEASEFILSLLSAPFLRNNRHISLMINRMSAHDCRRCLDSGWIDFVMLWEQADHSIEKTAPGEILLGTVEDTLLCGPGIHRKLEEGADPRDIPLILPGPADTDTGTYLSALRPEEQFKDGDIWMDNAESRLSLARADHGMTIFPQTIIAEMIAEKELFPVRTKIPFITHRASLLFHEDNRYAAEISELITVLKTGLCV